MSEQDAAATVQPTADSPENGTGTQDESINYQERYQELEKRFQDTQSWAHRSSEEAAALREKAQLIDDWNSGDPDAQKRAAEALGILLQEEEGEDLEAAGEAGLSPEDRKLLEEFRQERTHQQQTQAEQRQYDAYRSDVDPQLERMSVPKELHDAVAEAALTLPGIQTPQGLKPDLEGAIKQIEQFVMRAAAMPGVQPKLFEQLRQSKRAPHVSSSGTAGTQVPDLDKRSDRVAHMVERLQADQL